MNKLLLVGLFSTLISFSSLNAEDISHGTDAFQAKKHRCSKGLKEVLACLDTVGNQIEIQKCRIMLLKLANRVKGEQHKNETIEQLLKKYENK